jgi:division protein CdvB (Snf7/Vps24/ESCRT-III family)
LRLQRAGKLDDNTDLGIGVTNTMNRLLTLYNEMKISVDSWRNNKHSFQKATRKMIQYEEELMKEDDPQIIRQLKSALKGCIETHERIKSSRKKIKLFSLQLDMVTTKFENMGHLLFQSGSNVSNNNFLGELDQLSSTIAQSQTGFSESLEELEMDLGDIDFESEFNHKDIHALKEIKKEAKITEELFNSDFFEDI